MAIEYHGPFTGPGGSGIQRLQLFPGDNRVRKVALGAAAGFVVSNDETNSPRILHVHSASSPFRLPAAPMSSIWVGSSNTSTVSITAMSIDLSETWD